MKDKDCGAGKPSKEPMELQPEPIVKFFAGFGTPVEAKRSRGGVSIYSLPDRTPQTRLVPASPGDLVEILWWSHRDRWESIGDFGGMVMPLGEALQYVCFAQRFPVHKVKVDEINR